MGGDLLQSSKKSIAVLVIGEHRDRSRAWQIASNILNGRCIGNNKETTYPSTVAQDLQ